MMISIVYGLWKRFGSCLIGLIVPLMLLGAPFVFIIAPRQGAVTAGVAVALLCRGAVRRGERAQPPGAPCASRAGRRPSGASVAGPAASRLAARTLMLY